MKTIQLEERHLQKIREILTSFPSVQKAAVFGSRALGKSKRGSDVDLVLYGDVDEQTLGRVRTAMDDTSLPYFFDVLVYDAIHHPALLQHIDQQGSVVYERRAQ